MGEKICGCCGELKQYDDYYFKKNNKDGFKDF